MTASSNRPKLTPLWRGSIKSDAKALVFAAIASAGLAFITASVPALQHIRIPGPAPAHLNSTDSTATSATTIDAHTAQAAGAWWLDDPTATAEFGFAPEYDRMVWRVSAGERSVLLDPATGETLAFEFESPTR